MCGIAGYVGIRDGQLIQSMLSVIRHRGPDASGFWYDANVPIAFGHNRLSILDLSERGKQPMWDSSGRFCITYNGEIYNYRQLREDLKAKGCQFRTNTDTEVLINLFCDEGLSCLKRLRGIWAFAIYDVKERKTFLVRDPFGVKPLYYAMGDHQLLFASEIKGLLRWEGLDKSVDEAAIFETLMYLWTPGPRTIFANIRKLAPGEVLTVSSDDVLNFTSASYGIDLPQHFVDEPEHGMIERLRKQLHSSVTSQLVSDVPVGAFLSGGLDSSAVVAMAERDGHNISRCYTMNYGGGKKWEGMVNDLQYARKVADYLGVECREIVLDDSIVDRVREMLWHMDEPQADLAPLNVLLIAEAARQNGDYVLLSGAGGDDIFSGYRRHVALMSEKWWAWMPAKMRIGLKKISRTIDPSSAGGRRMRKWFKYAGCSSAERAIRYLVWSSEDDVLDLFQEDFRQRVSKHDPLAVMRDAMNTCNGVDALSKMLYLDTRFFLTDHNLNYTDKMSMARGVEVRVPLIDIELVKMAHSIPSRAKVRGYTGKYIFKRAMESYLPKDVIYRPKTGFVSPIREWFRGALGEKMRLVLNEDSLTRRGWFSPRAVSDLFQKAERGVEDCHYLLLSVYLIEEWARMFIDGEYSEGISG